MADVYRITAPLRTPEEFRHWLVSEEPAREIEAWLRDAAVAADDDLTARWAVLERCLRGGKRSGEVTRWAAVQTPAAVRALLATETAALAKALVRASTHLAAHGIGTGWTEPDVVASRGQVPEVEQTAVRAERAARCSARPCLRAIDAAEMVLLWDALCLSSRGRWVDLGSGDGRSLARLAANSAASELVGTDVTWSYTVMAANFRGEAIRGLPPRTRYLVFGPGGGPDGTRCEYVQITGGEFRFADVLAETMRRTLGPRSASVVTLLFPLHMPQPTRAGPARSAAEVLLETAVALLADGGVGLVVTENREVLRQLGLLLLAHRRVVTIEYTTRPLSSAQLRAMGIEPYTPSAAELDATLGARFTARTASHAESFQAVAPFAWGFPLLFSVESGGASRPTSAPVSP